MFRPPLGQAREAWAQMQARFEAGVEAGLAGGTAPSDEWARKGFVHGDVLRRARAGELLAAMYGAARCRSCRAHVRGRWWRECPAACGDQKEIEPGVVICAGYQRWRYTFISDAALKWIGLPLVHAMSGESIDLGEWEESLKPSLRR